jgi:hypothetical protein
METLSGLSPLPSADASPADVFGPGEIAGMRSAGVILLATAALLMIEGLVLALLVVASQAGPGSSNSA